MSKINKDQAIADFVKLGERLQNPDASLSSLITSEHLHNPWFTAENVNHAVAAIARMLKPDSLTQWLGSYSNFMTDTPKKVGLILAGNIPLVGFHDVLCVLITGNQALIKASTNDARLIKNILNMLVEIEPYFINQFTFAERLEGFEAVIATGSNNSSRYFEYYFGKVPNIIRKNRNSIAVLTGLETTAQLHALGKDVFDYFGLGCRNVSKLMVPDGYDFIPFFEAIENYHPIGNHYKYRNNYDYNKSLLLVNNNKHLDNGFLLVKEDTALTSPLAVLHYETYPDLAAAQQELVEQRERIQCIVTDAVLKVDNQVVTFGQSQQPELWNYADGVDTMQFLIDM